MLTSPGVCDIISCYSRESKPYGLSYGEWTVKWWKWALSFPESLNPVFDSTGELANSKQQLNVFFLAGIFGTNDKSFPTRQCAMPYGKSILFPVINYEANMSEYPELKDEVHMLNLVSGHMDRIVVKECFINGQRIIPERVHSNPKIFWVSVNKDFPGLDKGKKTLAAADGYWIFLEPLNRGKYYISFKGSCEEGKLNSGANYWLTVV